jgi:hypothetical protein
MRNIDGSAPGLSEPLMDEINPESKSGNLGMSNTHEESLAEAFVPDEDEEVHVLYENGKRISTSGGFQKSRKVKNASDKTSNKKTASKTNSQDEGLNHEVREIFEAVTDSVNKTDSISGDLLREAMKIDDLSIKHLLLSIPDATLVYLDNDKTHSITMDKIRAEPTLLDTVDGTLKERVFQNPEPENTTSTALDQKEHVSHDPSIGGSVIQRPEGFMADLAEEQARVILEGSKNRTLELDESIFSNINANKDDTPVKKPPFEAISKKDVAEINASKHEAPEKAVEAGNLEKLLSIATTKDDLIAIVSKSNDLRDGLWGTQQTYSRDELMALIEATWNGEVGIDHLPRTAGFRETVDRIRENERKNNLKIAKQKTADELSPAMQATIEMENVLEVPEEKQIYGYNKDNQSFIYNYQKTAETKEGADKNKGIFRKLWLMLRK